MKQETLEEVVERLFSDLYYPMYGAFRRDGFRKGAKWQQEQNDISKVKRVEVIQHSPPYNGRAYTNYNAKDVEIQLQDDGKTLKIFLK